MNAMTEIIPPIEDIAMDYVADRCGVTPHALKSARNEERLIDARALFVFLMRSYADGVSYPIIARHLDRNHVDAINLHTRAVALRMLDPGFKDKCRDFAHLLRTKGDLRGVE